MEQTHSASWYRVFLEECVGRQALATGHPATLLPWVVNGPSLRKDDLPVFTCPLCGDPLCFRGEEGEETLDTVAIHIGKHLQSFSLISLRNLDQGINQETVANSAFEQTSLRPRSTLKYGSLTGKDEPPSPLSFPNDDSDDNNDEGDENHGNIYTNFAENGSYDAQWSFLTPPANHVPENEDMILGSFSRLQEQNSADPDSPTSTWRGGPLEGMTPSTYADAAWTGEDESD